MRSASETHQVELFWRGERQCYLLNRSWALPWANKKSAWQCTWTELASVNSRCAEQLLSWLHFHQHTIRSQYWHLWRAHRHRDQPHAHHSVQKYSSRTAHVWSRSSGSWERTQPVEWRRCTWADILEEACGDVWSSCRNWINRGSAKCG